MARNPEATRTDESADADADADGEPGTLSPDAARERTDLVAVPKANLRLHLPASEAVRDAAGEPLPACYQSVPDNGAYRLRKLSAYPPGYAPWCSRCLAVAAAGDSGPPGQPANVTETECTRITELREAGVSRREVAERFGYGVSTVTRHATGKCSEHAVDAETDNHGHDHAAGSSAAGAD